MDMNSSKLKEIVEDREAWHAAVQGVAKSQICLNDWITTWLINNVVIISGETQPYIYTYSFSPKLPSYPGCHITLSRVPMLHVRTRPPFQTCTLSLRFIVHPSSHSHADCWPKAFNSLIASDSPQDKTFNVPSGNRAFNIYLVDTFYKASYSDCSHEIKRLLLLGRKAVTNLAY